jgi:hypothetical protein
VALALHAHELVDRHRRGSVGTSADAPQPGRRNSRCRPTGGLNSPGTGPIGTVRGVVRNRGGRGSARAPQGRRDHEGGERPSTAAASSA